MSIAYAHAAYKSIFVCYYAYYIRDKINKNKADFEWDLSAKSCWEIQCISNNNKIWIKNIIIYVSLYIKHLK